MVFAIVRRPSRWRAVTSSVFIDREGSVTLIPEFRISLTAAMAMAKEDSSPLPSMFDITEESALDTCPTGLPSLPNIDSILSAAASLAEETESCPPYQTLADQEAD